MEKPFASIRFRWPLWIALACALPLTFLAFRTRSLMRTGFERSERDLEAIVVRQVGSSLEGRLGQAEVVAGRAGRVLGDREIPEAVRLPLILDLLGTEPLISHVGVYGADRKLIDEVRAVDRAGQASSPPVLPELSSETNGWLPVSFAADGTPLIRYVAVIGKAGRNTGFMLAQVDSTKLNAVVEGATQGLSRTTSAPVLVLTRDGQRIAGGADPARVAQFLRETKPPEDAHALISWSGMRLAGASVNASLLPMEARDWRILMIRSEQDAYPEMLEAEKQLLLVSVAIVVIAIVFGLWLALRTARPILRLVKLTEAYSQRLFTQRSDVRTGDELELLGEKLEGMADSLLKSEEEIARRARVESDLSRYLPAHIAQSIAAGTTSIALGGERKVVTVMFADVVAFTHFSDTAEPEQVVLFLNELFGLLSEIVFKHGGTVDKFMGDCLMAIFGAPDGDEHEARALACAEDMHRFIEAMQTPWNQKFSFNVQLGIGMASGAAVVGNLGSEKRMEYTAIGDVVNVAARLEGMARPGQTLLTGAVVKGAGDTFEFASLGAQALRGKSEKTEVFELVVS